MSNKNTSTDTTDKAFHEGGHAFDNGVPADQNPYITDDPRAGHWEKGYRQAETLQGLCTGPGQESAKDTENVKPDKRDYQQEARELRTRVDAWLQEHGAVALVQLIGDSCPEFCGDKGKAGIGTFPRKTHIHGQHYQLFMVRTVRNQVIQMVIDFWNSYRDAEINCTGRVSVPYARTVSEQTRRATPIERKEARRVTACDVLSCVEFADPGSFEEFCSEFGYDTGSRKAEGIWRKVGEQARDLARMFSREEREELGAMVGEL